MEEQLVKLKSGSNKSRQEVMAAKTSSGIREHKLRKDSSDPHFPLFNQNNLNHFHLI